MSVAWTDTVKEIAGIKLHVSRAGSGPTVLVLHHDIGTVDRLPFYDTLAAKFDVVIPHHPGLGQVGAAAVDAPPARYRRDLCLAAGGSRRVRRVAGRAGFRRLDRGGNGEPGAPGLSKLVLVGAMGIKPPEGDIADQAIVSYHRLSPSGFHDQAAFARVYGDVTTDQLEAWDIAREMSFRTAWKPYMYSQTLPHLLGGVRTPALIIWGDDDRIVPLSAGHAYARALHDATLTTIPACGHFAEMEKPDVVAKLAIDFLSRN